MIYIIIFLLPFGPKFPSKIGNIHVTSVFLFWVICLWLIRILVSKKYVKTKLNFPIFCFVIMYAIFVSIHYLRGTSERTGFLRTVQMIEYAMLYFIAVNLFDTRRQIKRLIYLFFTAVSLEVIVTIVHYHYPMAWVDRYYSFDSEYFATQMVGTFSGEHNGLAPYLLLGLMLLWGQGLKGTKKILLLMSSIPFLYCILFSLSRTSYIAILVGLLTILVVDEINVLSRLKRVALATSLIAILIFSISSYEVLGIVKDRAFSIYTGFLDPYTAVSAGARTITIWEDVLVPIFSFHNLFDSLFGVGVSKGVIHNSFALALYNTGIIGFIIFIWLLYATFREIFETLKRTPKTDNFMKGFLVGFMGAFGSLIIFGLAGSTMMGMHRLMGNYWILLGAISAYRIRVIPRFRNAYYSK